MFGMALQNCLFLVLLHCVINAADPWKGIDWLDLGKNRINDTKHSIKSLNVNEAKNVVFFLGDGMGYPTVAATRAYKAQNNFEGPNSYLFFENFPHQSSSRTYSVDKSTADSASTATAYLCGVKNNLGTIGVNENVLRGNCNNYEENRVLSIAKLAIEKGMWVGLVTTSKVTDASPAGLYAQVPDRSWEATVSQSCQNVVKDIAYQLIHNETPDAIKVILGGGKDYFEAKRDDDKNLIEEWKVSKRGKSYEYVETKSRLESINTSKVEYLLGLFADDVMSFDGEKYEEPSLSEMSDAALKILSKAPNGYLLFVEGARIDHAHHANKAFRAIKETLAFEKSIKNVVTELGDDENTLVIVTADHSHSLSFGGYGDWSESVLGFAGSKAKDEKEFLQLNYINGPGYESHRMEGGLETPRKEIKREETEDADYVQDAGIWLSSATHQGEDVPIYAAGPWAHLFQRTEEQTYIAHVVMHAACLGDYKHGEHCPSSASTLSIPILLLSYIVAYYLGFSA